MSLVQNFLARFSIRGKLWFGFGSMLAVIIAVVGITLANLAATRNNISDIVEQVQPAVFDAFALARALEHTSSQLGFYLLSKEAGQREAYEQNLYDVRKQMDSLQQRPLLLENPELATMANGIAGKVEEFAAYRQQMLELSTQDGLNFPAMEYAGMNVNPLSQQALQLLSQMILAEEDELPGFQRKQLLVLFGDLRYAWTNVMNGIRGYLAFRTPGALDEIELHLENVQKLAGQMDEHAAILNFEQQDAFEQFVDLLPAFHDNFREMYALHSSEQWRTDAHLVRESLAPLLAGIKEQLDELVAELQARTRQGNADLLQQVDLSRLTVLALLAIGILLALSGAWIISQLISRPLRMAVHSMVDIASGEGDLDCQLQSQSRDELGQLCAAFNQFVMKIRDIILQVSNSISQLAAASEEMSRISTATRTAVQQQQQDTGQVATAMNGMAATVQEMARHAGLAAESAIATDTHAGNGRQVVEKTMEAIGDLAQAVEHIADAIHQLEDDSDEIGVVVDVISGIAGQTNLLALNAAIEAARAGDQGRGFAVVADEVRTLASRTQQSTVEIKAIIEKLQKGANDAVALITKGRVQANASVEQATQAGSALQQIAGSVVGIMDMNRHIAAAAEQQKMVAEEISHNVANITGVAEQTVSETRQLAAASEQLAGLAEHLRGLVGQFRVHGGPE